MQVHREGVEVLLGLGEEQAAEGHVAARLHHRKLEMVAHQMAAEQCRQPVAVGVPAHAHEAGGGVEHITTAPILHLREAAAGVVLEVHLKRARVQRLFAVCPWDVAPGLAACFLGISACAFGDVRFREVRGKVVLVHAEVARASADH